MSRQRFLNIHLGEDNIKEMVAPFLPSYPKGEQKAGEACRFASSYENLRLKKQLYHINS